MVHAQTSLGSQSSKDVAQRLQRHNLRPKGSQNTGNVSEGNRQVVYGSMMQQKMVGEGGGIGFGEDGGYARCILRTGRCHLRNCC